MDNNEGSWATVATRGSGVGTGPKGRLLVSCKRGYVFLEDPGNNTTTVRPKRVARIDSNTVSLETGFWNYAQMTLRFDSPTEAERFIRDIEG